MSSNKNAGVFAVIAEAEGELRATMLANVATVRKVSVEEFTASFEAYIKENADKLEKEKRKNEREARKVRVEVLVKEGESITLESDNLADFIGRVKAEEGVVSVNEDLSLTVTVSLPKARGTGGGKPAKLQPSGYVDSEGDRIFGALTDWTRDNLSESEQKEAGAFRPNGKFRTGASLAKALVKAEVIVAKAVTAEETATFEASKAS
jgi:hypothetical protein